MKELIGFEHKGINILNPFLSEEGQFDESPEYYGFHVDWTGGSCRAWSKCLRDGTWVVVTGPDGVTAPAEFSEGCIIGLYDGNPDGDSMWGYELDVHLVPSGQDMLDMMGGDAEDVIRRLRAPFMRGEQP